MTTHRLARESSPYLRQHAHNPVDWFPWGEEALTKASAENKPIFLSIGYSTCHWCHVMERESFEDPDTAALLNGAFICIKVDREERPDLDRIYMAAVQAMTGQGGWPMSIWLTPDRQPFFCGTYFPRETLRQLCRRIHELWETRGVDIRTQANQITAAIAGNVTVTRNADGASKLDAAPIKAAVEEFSTTHDVHHGGFGGAPKFPRAVALNFLMRTGGRDMALHQLRAMAHAGIHDQLGGGFHRYSVDERWLVPHFEKMLYDQAQLIINYVEAWQFSGESFYRDVAQRTAEYVLRDLTSPEDAFYSAEDADSEGVEGKFYVWTRAEIAELLGGQTDRFCKAYGVTGEGNWEEDVNILHVVEPGDFAPERIKLFEARSKRIRPHRDEKVLTSWNGLMISALARLGDTKNAGRAAAYILTHHRKNNRLWRTPSVPAMLDDYANLATGMLDLYEATLDVHWLDEASRCADQLIQLFYDPKDGGFFQTDGADTSVILRAKDDYDGAEPSGNAQATLLLLRLSAISETPRFREAADQTLALFSGVLKSTPYAFPQMLCALDFAITKPSEVTLTGNPDDGDTQALLRVIHEHYLPNKVIRHRHAASDRATAQLCTNNTCQIATGNPAQLKEFLDARRLE